MCYYFCFSSFRSTVICHHYHHWKIAQEISRISCRISCTEKEGKRNRESIGAHGTLCLLKCLRCLFLLLLLFPIIYLTVLLFERESQKNQNDDQTDHLKLTSPDLFLLPLSLLLFPFLEMDASSPSAAARFRCRETLPLPLFLSHLVVNLSISISAAVTKSRREGKGKK